VLIFIIQLLNQIKLNIDTVLCWHVMYVFTSLGKSNQNQKAI